MREADKITAADVMTEEVLILHDDTPIQEALETFEEYGVSAAPVVDASERCIGVLSVMDLIRRDVEELSGEAPHPEGFFNFLDVTDDTGLPIDKELLRSINLTKEDYDEQLFERETVGEWMSGALRVVAPQTPLTEVCRRMVDERVHRVLVMEGEALKGIVTAFDIVRFVAGVELPAEKARRAGDARRRGGPTGERRRRPGGPERKPPAR